MILPFHMSTKKDSLIKHPQEDEPQADEGEGSTMLTAPVDDEIKRRPTSNRKKIIFDREVTVRTHTHLNDMSRSEIKKTWYTADELATIRAQCCESIRRIMNGNKNLRRQTKGVDIEESILSCNCRGLEYRTNMGSKVRFEHRLSAWDVVELEQNRQWDEGTFDEDKIAEVYHACVDESSRVAHLLALLDQQWVQDHKYDTPLLSNVDTSFRTAGICCISVCSATSNDRGSSPHRQGRQAKIPVDSTGSSTTLRLVKTAPSRNRTGSTRTK
jgi:hypothetical protein